jgi:hypothetical protein
MFEHKAKPVLPRKIFIQRQLYYLLISFLIICVSLFIGIIGYRFWGGLSWLDAFYNSSMILTGMGPVNPMDTAAGKLFASFYALFSGIAFLSTIAVTLAPVVHRFLHKFHLRDK